MAIFFFYISLLLTSCYVVRAELQPEYVIICSVLKNIPESVTSEIISRTKPAAHKPALQPQQVQYVQQAVPVDQQNVQYVYVPYVPQQGMPGQQYAQPVYQYAPHQQQPAPVKPQGDGTPNVGEVMTAFAGVLTNIIVMGMGTDNGDQEQQAQGLAGFINSGAQLISILTRKPCTPEQFIDAFTQAIEHHEQEEQSVTETVVL